MVTLTSQRFRSYLWALPGWPDKQVDKMLAPLVNQGRDRPAVQIIEASTDQEKSLSREVMHGRREIELPLEPRFHGLRVRVLHIDPVARQHFRAYMSG